MSIHAPHHLPLAGRFLIPAAALVIVVAGIKVSAPIIVTFLLSLFIAVITAPPFFWLQRRKVPAIIAVLLVISAVIAMGMFVAAMVGNSINDFQNQLPYYQERLQQKTLVHIDWLREHGLDIPKEDILDTFNPGDALKMAAGVLNGLSGMLTNTFLILLTVTFMLLEAASVPAKLRLSLTNPEDSLPNFERFITTLQQYMAIKTWISLATGLLVSLWLFILGVDYPLLWGLLAFLFNYVPNIGSLIAAVPAVLLALIQLGAGHAALTALGFLAVNLIMGNVVEPKVMGRGLGLSTLVVFLSLVFWGWVLGLVGMLLAVPLTMAVKIGLESGPGTSNMAILLGPEPKAETTNTISPNED
ncbi:MAG: AI-2E family transporter [Desulfobulbaceae bacterium]|uniref:AI-2E family transporter n=1 Tax=Candidatus Desulfatifera sulfidica TaxID=2841691 RepID=A0A8J6N9X5_9BACT|nr:AI-2E family transporter [Candidatus Desulfatifera sulfidica]